MGLISAITGAAGGVLADSWRDYFYADSLEGDIIVTKGKKRVDQRGSNNKSTNNVITDGSIIAVADGQCMIVVENGRIKDVCAETGKYVYSNTEEPTIFAGNLKETVKRTWEQFKNRLVFGGGATGDTRVYYVNTKEIPGFKFGTTSPIPYRIVDSNIGLDIDSKVRCHGSYSFKVVDPLLFYQNVSGNVDGDYRLEGPILQQMTADLLDSLQPAFGRLSGIGSRYSDIPNHTKELSDELNSIMSSEWGDRLGIEIVSFAISGISIPPEDEDLIKQLQRTAVFQKASMAAANLNAAQADAMRDAAKNSAGAMMGFAGMNMAAQTGGINANQLYQMAADEQARQQMNQAGQANTMQQNGVPQQGGMQQASGTWTCSHGHGNNTGKFCSECGEPKPVAASIHCSACGYTPNDPSNPPKFCPECGKPF
ncbi:SPFH domain-containing protein [Lachnoanaerobaculum gingivalis]|uniref:SPFH domain-containing protein n=1 Tax=Lachnoanaerobaculum gingivalis TaxID=2490855 RepID=UPI0028D759A7|nr:SPFH domain-containing protein [Lachnoanaerobaculum gingivalis]